MIRHSADWSLRILWARSKMVLEFKDNIVYFRYQHDSEKFSYMDLLFKTNTQLLFVIIQKMLKQYQVRRYTIRPTRLKEIEAGHILSQVFRYTLRKQMSTLKLTTAQNVSNIDCYFHSNCSTIHCLNEQFTQKWKGSFTHPNLHAFLWSDAHRKRYLKECL